MTQLTAVHLQPRSGLHLGAHSADPAAAALQASSDTLFAALLSAHRLAGGDAQAWSAAFQSDPPFLLTSAFPRVGGLRFYPLPVAPGALFANLPAERGKQLKRLTYFSEELLRRRLSGRPLDAALFPADEYDEPTDGLALQGGALWLTKAELPLLPEPLRQPERERRLFALRRREVWSTGRIPRVAVARSSSASTLFHIGRTDFAPACGLWFGVQWRRPDAPIGDRSARSAFARALAFLQDGGLGGERSVGYGAFQAADPVPLDLPLPRPGAPAYLLSRYHPTPDELRGGALTGSAVAYHTARVGGFLRSPDAPAQLRRSVRLIEAGSLITWPAAATAGDLVDVRPRPEDDKAPFPHPVWRYGYALGVAFPEARHG